MKLICEANCHTPLAELILLPSHIMMLEILFRQSLQRKLPEKRFLLLHLIKRDFVASCGRSTNILAAIQYLQQRLIIFRCMEVGFLFSHQNDYLPIYGLEAIVTDSDMINEVHDSVFQLPFQR